VIKNLTLMFVIMVITSGCGFSIHTRKTVLPRGEEIVLKRFYVKSYVVGTKTIAYIGQPMAWWQPAKLSETQVYSLVIEKDFKLSGTYKLNSNFAEDIYIAGFKGDICKLEGETVINGIKYFVITIKENEKYGLLIDSNGMLNKFIITDHDFDRGYAAIESIEPILSPPDALFVVKKKVEENPYGIKRELIFGGVNNVSINVTYREYTPDEMARQAFYQNIIYQTSAELIRFQDIKIKVHEVTSEKIIYTVLEDGLGMPKP